MANRRVTTDYVACSLQISEWFCILNHPRQSFRKVCARWVPREHAEEYKRNRVEICQRLLDHYSDEGGFFRENI